MYADGMAHASELRERLIVRKERTRCPILHGFIAKGGATSVCYFIILWSMPNANYSFSPELSCGISVPWLSLIRPDLA